MLRSYYKYWEEFVNEWFNAGGTPSFPLKGWTDPDPVLVLGCVSQYLPEPWWGNDGDEEPLHSVVINYNPGEGGPNQEYSKLKHWYKSSYANDIVKTAANGTLAPTENWHKNRRALPVLNALHKLGHISKPYGLKNHLSIELIPWHTKAVNASYWNYFDQNIVEIYEHVLKFAACASHEINNCVLKRKVLIRCGKGAICKLIGELNFNGIATHPLTKIVSLGKSTCFFKFNIEGIKNVEFVALWGPTGNDMPANLADVFKHKEF